MTAFQASPGEAIAQARTNLFVVDAPVAGVRRIIGYVIGANLNQTNTDIPIPLLLLPNQNFVVTGFSVNNASISLTTATLGLNTVAAAGTGNTVLVTAAAVSACSSANINLAMTIAAGGTGQWFTNAAGTPSSTSALLGTAGTLYARVGTAQGAAATADLWVWGEVYL